MQCTSDDNEDSVPMKHETSRSDNNQTRFHTTETGERKHALRLVSCHDADESKIKRMFTVDPSSNRIAQSRCQVCLSKVNTEQTKSFLSNHCDSICVKCDEFSVTNETCDMTGEKQVTMNQNVKCFCDNSERTVSKCICTTKVSLLDGTQTGMSSMTHARTNETSSSFSSPYEISENSRSLTSSHELASRIPIVAENTRRASEDSSSTSSCLISNETLTGTDVLSSPYSDPTEVSGSGLSSPYSDEVRREFCAARSSSYSEDIKKENTLSIDSNLLSEEVKNEGTSVVRTVASASSSYSTLSSPYSDERQNISDINPEHDMSNTQTCPCSDESKKELLKNIPQSLSDSPPGDKNPRVSCVNLDTDTSNAGDHLTLDSQLIRSVEIAEAPSSQREQDATSNLSSPYSEDMTSSLTSPLNSSHSQEQRSNNLCPTDSGGKSELTSSGYSVDNSRSEPRSRGLPYQTSSGYSDMDDPSVTSELSLDQASPSQDSPSLGQCSSSPYEASPSLDQTSLSPTGEHESPDKIIESLAKIGTTSIGDNCCDEPQLDKVGSPPLTSDTSSENVASGQLEHSCLTSSSSTTSCDSTSRHPSISANSNSSQSAHSNPSQSESSNPSQSESSNPSQSADSSPLSSSTSSKQPLHSATANPSISPLPSSPNICDKCISAATDLYSHHINCKRKQEHPDAETRPFVHKIRINISNNTPHSVSSASINISNDTPPPDRNSLVTSSQNTHINIITNDNVSIIEIDQSNHRNDENVAPNKMENSDLAVATKQASPRESKMADSYEQNWVVMKSREASAGVASKAQSGGSKTQSSSSKTQSGSSKNQSGSSKTQSGSSKTQRTRGNAAVSRTQDSSRSGAADNTVPSSCSSCTSSYTISSET